MNLKSLLPDEDILISLEPEELAAVILKVLVSADDTGGILNSYNFTLQGNLSGYSNYKQVSRAVMEAWVWLEGEGLIAQKPGDSSGNWVFVTRRGKKANASEDWEAYQKADQLPRKFLHPIIALKVWATFLRGDYETAVFQAYKELEVKVRDSIGEAHETIGVDLMRKAFHAENGKLTDKSVPTAERDALANLFAGAVGSYKNPHSHRKVEISTQNASEMIILASHLLNIVEERASLDDT